MCTPHYAKELNRSQDMLPELCAVVAENPFLAVEQLVHDSLQDVYADPPLPRCFFPRQPFYKVGIREFLFGF